MEDSSVKEKLASTDVPDNVLEIAPSNGEGASSCTNTDVLASEQPHSPVPSLKAEAQADREPNNEQAQEEKKTQGKWRWELRHSLFLAQLLITWCVRMWEFSVALLLLDLYPSSLLLPAIHGLVESTAVVLFGSWVGNMVDRNKQITVVQSTMLANCFSVAASTVLLVVGLHLPGAASEHALFPALVTGVYILAAVTALSSVGTDLAVARLWTKVIAEDHDALANMNAVMRRIDLSCKLLAPLAAGVVMTWVSPTVSAIVFSSWQLVSFVPALVLLRFIYFKVPVLQTRHLELQALPTQTQVQGKGFDVIGSIRAFFSGWPVYFKQKVVRAALALSLLYMTLLSFGSVMTAYLKFYGMSEVIISITRGVAALFGLTATVVYGPVQKRIGVVRTGLIATWLQSGCLMLCIAATFVSQGSVLSLGLLVAGVITSRFGLWLFDLSVSQTLQEDIEESKLAEINGVQSSLNNTLQLVAYALSVLFSKPEQFNVLTYLSVGSVLAASVLYSSYSRKVRGHLLHLERAQLLFAWINPSAKKRSYGGVDQDGMQMTSERQVPAEQK